MAASASASAVGPELRPATWADRDQVLAWNGAPEARARSIDPRPISPAAHGRWFAARLADPLTPIWIIVQGGQPAGVVRVERTAPDQPGRISIVLDPLARGRGVGRWAVLAAARAAGGSVVADIARDNVASQACFAAAGFTLADPGATAAPFVRYQWSPA